MKYRVDLTTKAESDVDGVLRWFHEQKATVAGGRWLRKLLTRIDTLETQPESCRAAAERDELGIDVRELLFGRRPGIYRILFIIEGQAVRVLHIRHAARAAVSKQDLQ